MTRREVLLCFLVLLVLLAGLLGASGATTLFTRRLWLDEIYTHALVADPSFVHAMRALADGVETHPPALYVLLRGFAFCAGTSEAALRTFPLLCVGAALTGVYFTLRQTFPPFVAALATTVVGCHPVVLVQAFEARHYALWMAGIAWLAYVIGRSREAALSGDGRRIWGFALALVSVLICTTHYFGIVSLGLVLGGVVLVRPGPQVSRLAGLWPAITGPLALLACTPLLLGQRAATTVPTWVAPAERGSVVAFLLGIIPPPYAALAALALAVLVGTAWRRRRQTGPPWVGSWPSALTGLGALGLLPALLVAFSFLVQSVLVDRYAAPSLLVFAPLMAAIVRQLPRAVPVLVCAVLAVLATKDLGRRAQEFAARDEQLEELIVTLRSHTEGPVAFERPHDVAMVCHYAPDLAERCFLLDFETGQLSNVSDDRVFARDLARRFERYYGRPALLPWDSFRALPHRYLVRTNLSSRVSGPPTGYPGLTAESRGKGVFELIDNPNPKSEIRNPKQTQNPNGK